MNENIYPYYIFLHTNGNLVSRTRRTVEKDGRNAEEYFSQSETVTKWWKVRSQEEYQQVEEESRKILDSQTPKSKRKK